MPTPPPKPPRRDSSQTVRLSQMLAGERQSSIPDGGFPEDEEVTRPQSIEFRAALLVRYFKDCAPEDQDYLIQCAERYANRNRKS